MSRRDLRKKIEVLREAMVEPATTSLVSPETKWALETYARLKHEQDMPPFETPVAFTPEEERALELVARMREAG